MSHLLSLVIPFNPICFTLLLAVGLAIATRRPGEVHG